MVRFAQEFNVPAWVEIGAAERQLDVKNVSTLTTCDADSKSLGLRNKEHGGSATDRNGSYQEKGDR